MLYKLLQGDDVALHLMDKTYGSPFNTTAPKYIRAELFEVKLIASVDILHEILIDL